MRTTIAATLLGLGSVAYAGTQQQCQGNICYSLNIPDATASSGSGDIYMQITGPTSYSWIGLGQGSGMSGAQIFVMYTDSSGSNVTLSPRLGTGHVMPNYNSGAQVTLLDGSGVSNGQMTANFKCSSCSSWSGGSMDLTGSSFGFIFAALEGSPLNSDSTSATISQHSNTYGTFSFNSNAKGGSDVNPFTSSNGTSTTSSSGSSSSNNGCAQGSNSGTPTSSGGSSSTTTSGSGGYGPFGGSAPSGFRGHGFPSSFPTGGVTRRESDNSCPDEPLNNLGSSAEGKIQTIMIAHGVMAALAFVVLFPFGAISIRLMSFPGLVWFHAAFQALTYVVYIIAFGMGIWLATNLGYLQKYHPVIGIVLFVMLFFQPLFGFLHHSGYKKYQRRTIWSYGHLWNGRIVITLGMINGGLGFLLADNTKSGPIAYGIIAAIMWLIYVAAIIIGNNRKAKARTDTPPKYEDAIRLGRSRGRRPSHSPDSSPDEYYAPQPRSNL